MKAAIETSRDIDVEWVCRLWGYRTAYDMCELLHGFHQLTKSNDIDMLAEVRFLESICFEKEDA